MGYSAHLAIYIFFLNQANAIMIDENTSRFTSDTDAFLMGSPQQRPNLTLSQTINFRLFQSERVCRRQF